MDISLFFCYVVFVKTPHILETEEKSMGKKREIVMLVTGLVIGVALAPTAAHAASELLTATPSTQTFFVNGERVELEAYAIHGNNFVMLRDIGQAVGFNVYYDSANNAAIMEPDKPYTGEATQPTTYHTEDTDYSLQANPTAFTGTLTRKAYNAIRYSLENQEAIIGGTQEPVKISGEVVKKGSLGNAIAAISVYPVYELVYREDGYVCDVRYPEAYAQAATHTQSFVNGLAGKNDKEKVEAIAWYVADRLTYATSYSWPNTVLTQDGVVPGACMSYAYSFQFLCNRAGVPCVRVTSETHQWNMVYVDGQWWDVDVSANDMGDEVSLRPYQRVLTDPSERFGIDYTDYDPEATTFAQELLVPNSIK